MFTIRTSRISMMLAALWLCASGSLPAQTFTTLYKFGSGGPPTAACAPAQIAQAMEQPLKCCGAGLVGGETNRRRPAESQDGDHLGARRGHLAGAAFLPLGVVGEAGRGRAALVQVLDRLELGKISVEELQKLDRTLNNVVLEIDMVLKVKKPPA